MKERRAFASATCTRLIKDKLITRIEPKPRTCIPKGFNPYVRCYYHIDVSGHKIEDCWALRHKIQDLIDEGMIIIDLLNQKEEINDSLKAYHANHPDPPRYSPTILSSLEILDQIISILRTYGVSIHLGPKSPKRASPSANQLSS